MAFAVFADQTGKVYDHPDLELAGQSGRTLIPIREEDLIPLPDGSKLFTMEGRSAVGWDRKSQKFVMARGWDGPEIKSNAVSHDRDSGLSCKAVAAFLPPGYTRLHLPACFPTPRMPQLPLWTYTALGWTDRGFSAAAVRIDPVTHSEPCHYDDREIILKINKKIEKSPQNRLLHHLKHCALSYHCLAAKNLFMERWEAPLPTSPSCNAFCAGCLSLQPENGCIASHERIDFIPTVDEVVQVALPHLTDVPQGIVSFGQGCEGEPLLQFPLLEASIRAMREATHLGTIHLNTNGFDPKAVKRLSKAGLDSIRISLNSSIDETYRAYYRPKGFRMSDMVKSVYTAVDSGLYTALNLLVFPGVTDQEEEVHALVKLIRTSGVQMIQMRNLSMDPEAYLALVPNLKENAIGILNLIRLLRREFPEMEIGYFNRPKDLFGKQLIREFNY